jgi:O-antigen ligase
MASKNYPPQPATTLLAQLAGLWRSAEREHWLFVLPFLVMAPLLALLTMDPALAYSNTRSFSTPILMAELVLIVLALRRKPQGTSLFGDLAPATRILGGLWIGAILVSMAGAEFAPAHAQIRTVFTLLHAFFALALWSTLTTDRRLRHDCLGAAALGLGVFVLMAYGFGLWNMGRTDFPWTRFGVGVTNIRHFGYIALALTGISVGLWLNAAKGRAEVMPATLFFLGAFLLMWSGGRGAFIALLVQLAVLLAIAPTDRRIAFGLRLLGVLTVATLLAGLYIPVKHFGPLNIFLRLDTGAMPGEEYMTGRAEIWRQTAALIPEHLWFGYGEAQFRLVVPAARGFYNHPHNLPLQLLMQWGVIGTALLAVLLARIGWKALPLLKTPSDLTYPCVAVITGLLAVSMVDGPFFYPLPTMLFLLALAVLVAEAGEPEAFRK